MEEYKTVKGEACAEFTQKRSRFICHGKNVTSQDEAEEYINLIKSKYWDAKHNVYAYCIRNGNIKRSSDDGEPKGTAGAPALMKLEGLGLLDVVVVITRYFGGILLGTGGLVRAYSHGVEVAVNACKVAKMIKCVKANVKMSFSVFGKVEGIIREFKANIAECVYNNLVDLTFYIKEDDFTRIKRIINDISSGEADIKVYGKEFYCLD